MKKITLPIVSLSLLFLLSACSESTDDIYTDFCECADQAIDAGKSEFKECREYIDKIDELLENGEITKEEYKEIIIKMEGFGISKLGG